MPRVFVSHNLRDEGLARLIADELRRAGVDAVNPLWNMAAGSFRDQVLKTARQADVLIVIVSSGDTTLSSWGQYEVGLFDAQNKPVIVLASNKVPAAALPYEIREYRWHTFDPAHPELAARKVASDLLAAA
jgi:precorrin-6B methylase 1